jgi:hypothetical protein
MRRNSARGPADDSPEQVPDPLTSYRFLGLASLAEAARAIVTELDAALSA